MTQKLLINFRWYRIKQQQQSKKQKKAKENRKKKSFAMPSMVYGLKEDKAQINNDDGAAKYDE